jgi:hypothetical protein
MSNSGLFIPQLWLKEIARALDQNIFKAMFYSAWAFNVPVDEYDPANVSMGFQACLFI